MCEEARSYVFTIEEDEYRFRLEECEGLLFLHVDVYEWGLSLCKEMKLAFEECLAWAKDQGHTHVMAYTENHHFVAMSKSAELVETRGTYGVYVWAV